MNDDVEREDMSEYAELNNGYNLFRAEAVDYRFRRLTGEVTLLSSRSLASAGSIGLACLVALAAIFTQVKVPVYTQVPPSEYPLLVNEWSRHNQPMDKTFIIKTLDGSTVFIKNGDELEKHTLDNVVSIFERKEVSLIASILSKEGT